MNILCYPVNSSGIKPSLGCCRGHAGPAASYLLAGAASDIVRLPAMTHLLLVHFQVGVAMLARDSFGRSRGTRPVARPWHRRRGDAVTEGRAKDLITALDEASLSRVHLLAV